MRCLSAALLLLLTGCGAHSPLRVCADPNNLPFSNRAGQGLENKLAELVAADQGRKVDYVWWAQRRGNVRETLKAGRCDVVPGVGAGLDMLATTRPYYFSTYVAVTRADRDLAIASFDDPRLRGLKLGVQLIGDDFSNTPPAHALARRGLVANVRGYMVYGDYSRPAPQADIVRAVASGEVDVAFVWGPTAAWFARSQSVPLRLTRLPAFDKATDQPMAYSIAMGLRRGEPELKAKLEESLKRRAPEIKRLLAAYAVPVVASAPPPVADDD